MFHLCFFFFFNPPFSLPVTLLAVEIFWRERVSLERLEVLICTLLLHDCAALTPVLFYDQFLGVISVSAQTPDEAKSTYVILQVLCLHGFFLQCFNLFCLVPSEISLT